MGDRMRNLRYENVLVISPHTDDAEIACGGTLARLSGQGATINSIVFSACEESVPEGFPSNVLRDECVNAHAMIGIPEANCQILNFPVRHFPEHRQAILEEMVNLNRKYQPDLVLIPSIQDTHQDHNLIAAEGFRAFKNTTIWAYDCPWNQPNPKLNCFVSLNKFELERKIRAISAYESQKGRAYVTEEFIRALSLLRGSAIQEVNAEAFEIVKYIHR